MLIKMDVIRCPVSAGLNFRGTKLSRIAVEPRKPRKFRTAKIKVHTVCPVYAPAGGVACGVSYMPCICTCWGRSLWGCPICPIYAPVGGVACGGSAGVVILYALYTHLLGGVACGGSAGGMSYMPCIHTMNCWEILQLGH